jgi:hypothetical protein
MSDQSDDQQQSGSAFGDHVGDQAGDHAGGDPLAAPPPRPERRGSVPLALLAGIGVAILGIALWAVLHVLLEREIVGVSVVTAFAVGFVMRELARRSTIGLRVAAALITAVVCVAGHLVSTVAYTASQFDVGFVALLKDAAPDWLSLLTEGDGHTVRLLIFAAAVVVAFLAAGPKPEPKGKPAPVRTDDGEPPAMDLSR